MAFHTDFLTLCSTTVVVAGRTLYSGSGVASYGSGSTYTARVVRKPTVVRTGQGETVEYTHVAWVLSTSPIAGDAQIMWGSTTPQPAAVSGWTDEDGLAYTKILFGH